MEYYKNYSVAQKNFMAINGIKPVSSGFNETTQKHFQIYILDEQFSQLLTAFTEAKKKALQGD